MTEPIEINIAFKKEKWVEPFGDMRQELVFIGQNLDPVATRERLDECLLSESELMQGAEFWKTLDDPFPIWQER